MTGPRTASFPSYVDRVPLARRRKPDSWSVTAVEIALVLVAAGSGLFAYYRTHDLPFYATKFYAHLGSSKAQHLLSQYYLNRRDESPEHAVQAEHWLTKAAAAGHGIAAYNLALAHIRGDLPSNSTPEVRHVHGLLSQAVREGVHEALILLHYCGHGQCYGHQRQRKQQEQQQQHREQRLQGSLKSDP